MRNKTQQTAVSNVQHAVKSKQKSMMNNLTGNNEWNTPLKYVDSVRRVLGSIDTDPATNLSAQKTVKAATYHTIEADGLNHEWNGRVFMNPPYSRELIGKFTAKFVQELTAGSISAGIVLVNAATDTSWFHLLHEHATAYCLTKGRIAFQRAGDEASSSTKKGQVGSAFFYFGDNPAAFAREFNQYGIVE